MSCSVLPPAAPVKTRRCLFPKEADEQVPLDDATAYRLAEEYAHNTSSMPLHARVDQAMADLMLLLQSPELGTVLDQTARCGRAIHLLRELDLFVSTHLPWMETSIFARDEDAIQDLISKQHFVNQICHRTMSAFYAKQPHGLDAEALRQFWSIRFSSFVK